MTIPSLLAEAKTSKKPINEYVTLTEFTNAVNDGNIEVQMANRFFDIPLDKNFDDIIDDVDFVNAAHRNCYDNESIKKGFSRIKQKEKIFSNLVKRETTKSNPKPNHFTWDDACHFTLVYVRNTGKFALADGHTRWVALRRLAHRGVINPDAQDILVRVIARNSREDTVDTLITLNTSVTSWCAKELRRAESYKLGDDAFKEVFHKEQEVMQRTGIYKDYALIVLRGTDNSNKCHSDTNTSKRLRILSHSDKLIELVCDWLSVYKEDFVNVALSSCTPKQKWGCDIYTVTAQILHSCLRLCDDPNRMMSKETAYAHATAIKDAMKEYIRNCDKNDMAILSNGNKSDIKAQWFTCIKHTMEKNTHKYSDDTRNIVRYLEATTKHKHVRKSISM